jgi:hypothetical protein
MRLVTSTRSSGHRPSTRVTDGAASTRCSQLSSSSRPSLQRQDQAVGQRRVAALADADRLGNGRQDQDRVG